MIFSGKPRFSNFRMGVWEVIFVPFSEKVTCSFIFRPTMIHRVKRWVFKTCEDSSIHGLIWYTRIESKLLSAIIFAFCLLTIFYLPGYVIFKSWEFSQCEKILTTTSSLRLKVAKYPTITVCHGRYFTKDKLACKTYYR